jgi:YHS domain-containing protein
LSFVLVSSHLFSEANLDKAKVFDDVIRPVLAAKCYDCHGQSKDKGKLRLHTVKDLLKGGKGSGAKIIVKGKLDDSELYYRMSLPTDDDDAMPPFDKDEPHNPVTKDELKVFEAWILAGASFDSKVSDLKGEARTGAEAILKNPPRKKESATAVLQLKLPKLPPAGAKPLSSLKDLGILTMPVAQDTNALYVNASYVGEQFGDEQVKKLVGVSPQLFWLNLARTKVTNAGLVEVAKCAQVTRLHLENTSVSDEGLAHLAKLANLEYLNLYGTKVSDKGIAHLKKLKKLKKIFLWQTEVTKAGAADLRSAFVDAKELAKLEADRKRLKVEVDQFQISKEKEVAENEEALKKTASSGGLGEPVNSKCPVSGKDVDKAKKSFLEGQTVGFCCDNCKGKFDKDPSAFRAKLKDFKPSDAYSKAKEKLDGVKDHLEMGVKEKQDTLRTVLVKLRNVGPVINLGWQAESATTEKKVEKDDKQVKTGNPVNKKCPVSGKPIDKAQVFVFKGQSVAFCCGNCKAKFEKEPQKFLAKVDGFKK